MNKFFRKLFIGLSIITAAQFAPKNSLALLDKLDVLTKHCSDAYRVTDDIKTVFPSEEKWNKYDNEQKLDMLQLIENTQAKLDDRQRYEVKEGMPKHIHAAGFSNPLNRTIYISNISDDYKGIFEMFRHEQNHARFYEYYIGKSNDNIVKEFGEDNIKLAEREFDKLPIFLIKEALAGNYYLEGGYYNLQFESNAYMAEKVFDNTVLNVTDDYKSREDMLKDFEKGIKEIDEITDLKEMKKTIPNVKNSFEVKGLHNYSMQKEDYEWMIKVIEKRISELSSKRKELSYIKNLNEPYYANETSRKQQQNLQNKHYNNQQTFKSRQG